MLIVPAGWDCYIGYPLTAMLLI